MPSIDVVPPPIEDGKTEEKEAPAIKASVGIIYPPPEVRNIVDKTASFVARNGPEFENRIRQNEVNNPKFNFLQPTDPYHAYYQHKVVEFKEGRGQEPQAPKAQNTFFGALRPQETPKIVETFVPKEPPPEYEFMCDPPSISAYDLDIVKLTAQFTARNGRQFLETVMQREQRNYLFDFLRPQHSLFTYFTKLVVQYTKILIPPKNLKDKLNKEVNEPKEILDQVKYRVQWAKHQDKEKKKEEEALEKERVAYAQIDWHDFVVVETVDFQSSETGNLPPPTTPEEVGARILQMERFVRGEIPMDDAVEMEVESEGEEEEESDEEEEEEEEKTKEERRPVATRPESPAQDMEESSSESSEEEEEDTEDDRQRGAPPPPPPPPPKIAPPLPPTPEQVIIKEYNPKAKPAPPPEPVGDQFMISPITGEKIPAHKVQEHMRIGLLDPKWMEDRQRSQHEKQDQEEVFAPGSAIDSNLKQLAERRTDIFGVGTEETQIGKKIGEEEVKEKKVVWDGHTASMEKVSQLARENISIEDQIATIHRAKGLVPDEEKEKIGPSVPKAGAPPLPPQPPQHKPVAAPPPPPPQSQAHAPPPPPGPPHQMRPMQPMPPHMAPRMMNPGPPGPPMGMPQMMVIPPRPPMMMGMQPRPPMMAPMRMGMPPNPPMMARPPMGAPPGAPPPPPSSDEPPSKKAKTEESLMPEEEFLKTHKGNVKIQVICPVFAEKPEWNLKGQKLEYNLPLTDAVSVLKAKLNETLSLPAGKQKLQFEGMFIKDSNSFAFYNFLNGATVQLQVKERGGRKK